MDEAGFEPTASRPPAEHSIPQLDSFQVELLAHKIKKK